MEVNMSNLKNLKVGDKVTRWLGGKVPNILIVLKIENNQIKCGLPPGEAEAWNYPDWDFDLETGAEIDDYLNWGAPPLKTGSFIVPGEYHQ